TITILSGQTTGSVTATVTDDALVEDTETATFTISNPSSGITLGTKTSDDIQIVDNDKASVNLSVTSNTGLESGLTQITVTATASSNVFGGDQTVDISTSGLAIAGTDYTLDKLTITIPEGSNSGSVTFTVINDLIAEGDENAVLTIVNPSSKITLGTNRTETISITDDDVTDLTTRVTAPMKAFRYVKFDYVITVENLSGIDAENVQVNFTLPTGDGITFSYSGFTTSAGSGFVCANPDANRTIVCTKGKVLGNAQAVKNTDNTNDAIQQTATINLTVAANETGTLNNTTSNAIVDPNNVLTETNETNNTANLATSSGNQTTTVSMVTAAGISATGKVVNTKGRGIARVNVTINDTTTNETRSTFTTTNGEFSFDNLDSGHYYIVTVKAKRFTFDENQQGFQAFENTDLTFRANR
ncbi:MAG: carboxypeptidase regulatory-like domain-containing protein, partial [Pyrinomonadaceae bacterium]|nr:carboxypeptidase regulatory-like domain-containing protein [Pyrinomonadaceae bacterium]